LLSTGLQQFISAISGIVSTISSFCQWLNSGSAGAEALKAVIVGVTAAFVAWKATMAIQSLIGNVVSGIKNMVAGFSTLWATMMANPVTLIIAVIAGLVAAFVALWNNCEGFRNFWLGLWDGIKNIVSTAVDWIVNAFNKIIGFIKGNWQALLMMIVNPFAGAFKMLYDNCEGFRTFVNNFVTAVKNFFVNGWNAIKTATTTAWNNIKTAITNVLNNIKTGISNGINNAKTVISNGWNAVKTATTNAWNAIKTAITNVWNAIKTAVSNAINNAKTVISNGWNSVKTTTSNIWNGIKTTISNIWNGIKTTISNIINGVKSTISNAWNSVKTTTSNIWNGIKNTISNAIEAAKTKVSNVIEKIKGFFNFKITWPKIPMPHFAISPSGWKIGDLLQGSIPKLGIEWYAKGAILDKPTAFGVNGSNLMVGGEAGKEAVAPIETLQAYVKDAVRSEFNLMESYMMRLVQTVDEYLPKVADGRNVVLDTGALVGAMGSHMDNTLGNINRRKERWG
jgi:phage-related protein